MGPAGAVPGLAEAAGCAAGAAAAGSIFFTLVPQFGQKAEDAGNFFEQLEQKTIFPWFWFICIPPAAIPPFIPPMLFMPMLLPLLCLVWAPCDTAALPSSVT